jgi:hypothetical protein
MSARRSFADGWTVRHVTPLPPAPTYPLYEVPGITRARGTAPCHLGEPPARPPRHACMHPPAPPRPRHDRARSVAAAADREKRADPTAAAPPRASAWLLLGPRSRSFPSARSHHADARRQAAVPGTPRLGSAAARGTAFRSPSPSVRARSFAVRVCVGWVWGGGLVAGGGPDQPS